MFCVVRMSVDDGAILSVNGPLKTSAAAKQFIINFARTAMDEYATEACIAKEDYSDKVKLENMADTDFIIIDCDLNVAIDEVFAIKELEPV